MSITLVRKAYKITSSKHAVQQFKGFKCKCNFTIKIFIAIANVKCKTSTFVLNENKQYVHMFRSRDQVSRQMTSFLFLLMNIEEKKLTSLLFGFSVYFKRFYLNHKL